MSGGRECLIKRQCDNRPVAKKKRRGDGKSWKNIDFGQRCVCVCVCVCELVSVCYSLRQQTH